MIRNIMSCISTVIIFIAVIDFIICTYKIRIRRINSGKVVDCRKCVMFKTDFENVKKPRNVYKPKRNYKNNDRR